VTLPSDDEVLPSVTVVLPMVAVELARYELGNVDDTEAMLALFSVKLPMLENVPLMVTAVLPSVIGVAKLASRFANGIADVAFAKV